MGASGPPGSRVPWMDLGLSIGSGELGKRSSMAACRETGVKRSGGEQWMSEEGEGHPSLQLELKLSWPNGLLGRSPFCASPKGLRRSSYSHGHSSSPETTPAATDSAPTSEGGGVGVNGPPKKVGGCDNNHETGPSSSTSRSTEAGRARWRCSDEDVRGAVPRKKLRLTKEQSCYLEESFKEHATLNPKQKLAIAKKLNLRPRQVEVWFQNRRARTKLKQTEVEYEYMKRCCESLTEENRRLHREIQELRALKAPAPHLPATTLSMCPSCERAAARVMGGRRAGGFGAIPLKLRDGYPTMAYPVS